MTPLRERSMKWVRKAARGVLRRSPRASVALAQELFTLLTEQAETIYGPEGDVASQRRFNRLYRSFSESLMAASRPPGLEISHPREVELRSGAQSRNFMIDLMPYIQRYLSQLPRETKYTVLDVGAGSGHGSNLLASMYQTSILGYRLGVTALDINDRYTNHIELFCPYVGRRVGDIFRLDAAYDVVICSHTIEHVTEPLAFARRLQELARKRVFLAAPFNEREDMLTKGHINIIDDEFLEKLGALAIHKVHSAAWGAFLDPPYEMFIAELAGMAPSG